MSKNVKYDKIIQIIVKFLYYKNLIEQGGNNMAYANLHSAKDAKNDEWYTQISDVSKELTHYKQHFKGKGTS